MESAGPGAAGNKHVSDKNTLLAVLQLLRKYNLKVEYILSYETSIKPSQTHISGGKCRLYNDRRISCVIVDRPGGWGRVDSGTGLDVATALQISATTYD
jgi:hypothetical protein